MEQFTPHQVGFKTERAKLSLYTTKNTQTATSLLTSCKNLLQQADIRMRSHVDFQELIEGKSVANCQQTCKLILKTDSLQTVSTSCNKSANDELQQA